MFNFLKKKQKAPEMLSRDEIAAILHMDREALDAFEKSYREEILDKEEECGWADGFFDINAKQAAAIKNSGDRERADAGKEDLTAADELAARIVDELLSGLERYVYDGSSGAFQKMPELHSAKSSRDAAAETTGKAGLPITPALVTNEEIKKLPKSIRPELTGRLLKKDIGGDSYPAVLWMYKNFLESTDPVKKMDFYSRFRQGLDILDLDGITYEIIGMNPASMGYWLPAVVEAVRKQDFFKIPKTTVVKIPLPLLQLTRLDYFTLTPTTKKIVNQFCMEAFDLDESKEYFIKTGTYSSKYDFRNACVRGAGEVRELGEYLLFIHFQALQMASPLSHPVIYGVSTTNEWVVREYIPDKENNPCIYKGLPLHTEYRVFVDFDAKAIIGIAPYWDPETMKNRFSEQADADSPHQYHDYIIYKMHEDTLMGRYERNKETIKERLLKMLPDVHLAGQWSIDIMQNGDDFWIIDMAPAAVSALTQYVPKGLLKPLEEDWIPKLSE